MHTFAPLLLLVALGRGAKLRGLFGWYRECKRRFGRARARGHNESRRLSSLQGFGPYSLHGAARDGPVEAVEALLSRGAEINAENAEGDTALQVAVKNGRIDVVRVLLSLLADPNKASEHTRHGSFPPLRLAAHLGHWDIGNELLREGVGTRVDAPFRHMTALHSAICQQKPGYVSFVQKLLAKKANPAPHQWENVMESPLHSAARVGALDVLTILLDLKADINQEKHETHTTPLCSAVGGNQPEAVEVLLQRGANVNYAASFFPPHILCLASAPRPRATMEPLRSYLSTYWHTIREVLRRWTDTTGPPETNMPFNLWLTPHYAFQARPTVVVVTLRLPPAHWDKLRRLWHPAAKALQHRRQQALAPFVGSTAVLAALIDAFAALTPVPVLAPTGRELMVLAHLEGTHPRGDFDAQWRARPWGTPLPASLAAVLRPRGERVVELRSVADFKRMVAAIIGEGDEERRPDIPGPAGRPRGRPSRRRDRFAVSPPNAGDTSHRDPVPRKRRYGLP